MIYGSLFSGIGGFDAGFDAAGMSCAWQVEKDKAALGLLTRRWPNVIKYSDVKEIRDGQLAAVDVICGGFPCQDLSVAGRRAGLAGERSGLWFEFHRIIKSLKPRWAIIENVPGLLSSNSGRDFAVILRGLVECGYGIAWRILDAQYFGVAQRRRRVFIVGSLGNGSCAKVLFESEGVCGDFAKGREARKITPTLSASGTGTGRTGNDRTESDFLITGTMKSSGDAHSGFEYGDGLVPFVNCFNGYTGGADDNDAQAGHIVAFTVSPGKGNLKDDIHVLQSEIAKPLDCSGNPEMHQGGTVIAWHENKASQLSPSKTAKALRAGASHSYQGVGVRRLTPKECERLQGFADEWTKGESDSTRYRMLGNAVCMPVARWLGKRIIEASQ
jgi:DNA (cytosine-5)-methyltransferase 1